MLRLPSIDMVLFVLRDRYKSFVICRSYYAARFSVLLPYLVAQGFLPF